MKQGLKEQEVMERVTARDIELPKEVMLHYYLYCLDIQTGKVVWKREFYSGQPPGGRHRKNSFASETPVTDGNLVYVYVANLGLYAYDMKGTQVWHTPLEAYPIYLDFGTGGSPALDRKSTRLNSSHVSISYAVFCLKKKKTKVDGYHVVYAK